MTGYCQTCGGDPAGCRHGRRAGSILLESLGFAESRTPRRALRVSPPPAPAAPVATTVATAIPTRSTTGLVAELWDAEPDLPPFPPPVAAVSVPGRGFGLLRWTTGLLVACAIGAAAYLGTSAWLVEEAATELAAAERVLDGIQAPAASLVDGPRTIADPSTDIVALGAVSAEIAALEAATDELTVLTVRYADPLSSLGIHLEDPLAGRRSAIGFVVPQARDVADVLTRMLSVRLATEQLASLPELPPGADRTTVDQLSAFLVADVAEVRALADRLPGDLGAEVHGHADQLEAAVVDYVSALRTHDPEAEALATEVTAGRATIDDSIQGWLDAESRTAVGLVDSFVAAARSIG